MKVAIIGDVHGCYKTLVNLVTKIRAGYGNILICSVGDLIDRGPRSAEVIQFCIDNQIMAVRGNHEDMMLTKPELWGKYGQETRYSYDLNTELFEKHKAWAESLPVYLEFENCRDELGQKLVVSHASIGAFWRVKDDFIWNNRIMWNRDPVQPVKGVFNVFGHTKSKEPILEVDHAMIDTGCAFDFDLGLTALIFPNKTMIHSKCVDFDLG